MQAKIIGHLVYKRLPSLPVKEMQSNGGAEESGQSPDEPTSSIADKRTGIKTLVKQIATMTVDGFDEMEAAQRNTEMGRILTQARIDSLGQCFQNRMLEDIKDEHIDTLGSHLTTQIQLLNGNDLSFVENTRLLGPDALNVFLLTLKRGQCAASRRIWSKAPEAMRQLKPFTGKELPDIYKAKVKTLIHGQNRLLRTKDLYDKRAFGDVSLPPRAAQLIDKGAVGDELIELNMLLLEATIPGFHKNNLEVAMESVEAVKRRQAEKDAAARVQKAEKQVASRTKEDKAEPVTVKIDPHGYCSMFSDSLRKQLHKPLRMKQAVAKLSAERRCSPGGSLWLYQDYCIEVTGFFRHENERTLLVKEAVMKREKRLQGLKGLVDLEAKIKRASREPIPDDVRMFVWRRDGGRCVRCGSNENLEFDHIIPISKSGSSSERNLQLLCEKCNRSKSDAI